MFIDNYNHPPLITDKHLKLKQTETIELANSGAQVTCYTSKDGKISKTIVNVRDLDFMQAARTLAKSLNKAIKARENITVAELIQQALEQKFPDVASTLKTVPVEEYENFEQRCSVIHLEDSFKNYAGETSAIRLCSPNVVPDGKPLSKKGQPVAASVENADHTFMQEVRTTLSEKYDKDLSKALTQLLVRKYNALTGLQSVPYAMGEKIKSHMDEDAVTYDASSMRWTLNLD